MKKQRGEVDRISNLPGHIVDQILSCLSLVDVVRTSVLSRKWRYRWVTLPSLVFDDKSVLLPTTDETLRKYKLISIVDRVLLLHTGPIHKFKLSCQYLEGGSDIDKWIIYLSRVSVKEFILQLWRGNQYKVPSSIYSFQNLTHLELRKCVLKPPPEFNGFKSLKCLILHRVTMEQLGFEQMISSCPLLERLTLMYCDIGFNVFNIHHARNLIHLDVVGKFVDVSFTDTFNLAFVTISGLISYPGIDRNLDCDNLINFFTGLPHIQRLVVGSYFFKYLACGTIPEKLPAACLHLTCLSIKINFNDSREYLAALCVMRSSPNLQELELQPRNEEQDTTMVNIVENVDGFALNQLRLVNIVGISSLREELSFIQLLLQNSPLLERMTVQPDGYGHYDDGFKWDLVKKLLFVQRASASARIIYVDP